MLRIILGRAGSGKTERAREELVKKAETESCMLIVPEQYSFESERAMLQRLGAQNAQKVSVMSFTRLCEAVFRTYGGLAGRRLTDGGKILLMSMAIDSVRDNLSLYRKNTDTGELVGLMLSASAEMKICSVTPDALSLLSEKADSPTLAQKVKEISLVLGAYEALISQSYLDPMDDLTRMETLLREHDFFRDCTVVIDSFKSFTAQESGVLRQILRQAREVTVTLPADGLYGDETGLFAPVRKTAHKLIALAREEGIPVLSPEILQGGARYRVPELAFAEENLFRAEKKSFSGKAENIHIYNASDAYDEAEYAAAEILRLTREEKMRFCEIAVISRTPEEYRGCLDAALEKRNIPYFMDKPKSVEAKPLMHLVLSAFQAVETSYANDAVFAFLKTGLCTLSAVEIAKLENYTFLWNLSGKKWLLPFTANPKGLGAPMEEREKEELRLINELRERAVKPLQVFEKSIREASGKEIAEAVFRLLEHTGAPELLPELCANLERAGRVQDASEQRRLWNLLMGILDQTAAILGEKRVDAKKFAQLLRTVIQAEDISDIPQGLDEVTVACADRMRLSSPRAVFLLGVSKGDFPLAPSAGGVFTNRERQELIEIGLPLSGALAEDISEERLIAYNAVAAPSERLYLSWSELGGESDRYPSEVITELTELFGGLPEDDRNTLGAEFFADAPDTMFELAARFWQEKSPRSEAVKQYVASLGGYCEKLEAIGRAVNETPMRMEDPKDAKELFSGTRRTSATQIETYHQCRFRYFCRFGMGIKERRPARIDAVEYGSLMHFLLEKLFSAYPAEEICGMEEDALTEKLRTLIAQYAQEALGGEIADTPRFLSMTQRMEKSAKMLILHVAKELAQSKFHPESFEFELGKEGAALRIPLASGGEVVVDGKIDRVDVMEKDGVKYVRIVDYKTGTKEFTLADILYGINLQMLVYLAALVQNRSLKPAGILYMPAVKPRVTAQRDESEDAIEKKIGKALIMKGLVLSEEKVVLGMEESGEGKLIPAKIKGEEISGSVVSEEEFSEILSFVQKKVGAMADTLLSGDIHAEPLLQKNRFGCTYCPYGAICGKEYTEEMVPDDSDPDRTEILKQIGEEAEHAGT